MVFWIVCRDRVAAGGVLRFGPYESAAAAERALGEVRRRHVGGTAGDVRVVLDYV